jgi:predicted nuclease of predicted toxin-antitoxin system
MKLWLDAQLPPLRASWINEQEWGIQAFAVRDGGRSAARDPVIFRAAQEAGVVVLTKERDGIRLLDKQGPPPKEIWTVVYGHVETGGGVSVRCWGHGLRHAKAWSNARGCPSAGRICLLLPAGPNRVMG